MGDCTAGDVAGFAETKKKYNLDADYLNKFFNGLPKEKQELPFYRNKIPLVAAKVVVAAILRSQPDGTQLEWGTKLYRMEQKEDLPDELKNTYKEMGLRYDGGRRYYSDDIDMYTSSLILQRFAEQKYVDTEHGRDLRTIINKEGISELEEHLAEAEKVEPEFTRKILNSVGLLCLKIDGKLKIIQ